MRCSLQNFKISLVQFGQSAHEFYHFYDVSFKGICAFIDISQTKSYFFESSSLPVVKLSVSLNEIKFKSKALTILGSSFLLLKAKYRRLRSFCFKLLNKAVKFAKTFTSCGKLSYWMHE